jgi:hypothetical protein
MKERNSCSLSLLGSCKASGWIPSKILYEYAVYNLYASHAPQLLNVTILMDNYIRNMLSVQFTSSPTLTKAYMSPRERTFSHGTRCIKISTFVHATVCFGVLTLCQIRINTGQKYTSGPHSLTRNKNRNSHFKKAVKWSAYDPSYSVGRHPEDHSLKPDRTNLAEPISVNKLSATVYIGSPGYMGGHRRRITVWA